MLRIHVLGELLVERAGERIELSGSWRAASLLAWLALNPGEHPRGALAARFWPEVLDSSARASLRNSLWALRRAIGGDPDEFLVATRERVGLRGAPQVWLDADAFAEHLAAGRLDDALALSRGELLAGLEDEWVYEHREAHREQVSELFERMAARLEPDDPAGAVALTRKRVALDPLAEDAQRALIERLAGAGDRAGALAAYSRFRERLRREIGISPGEETRAAAERVRASVAEGEEEQEAGGLPPDPDGERPAATEAGWGSGARFPLPARLRRPAPAPFAGRGSELERLEGLWSEVERGGGARLALITGEAGIGKSRLGLELARGVERGGGVVLHGIADEDLLVPHQPVVEALAHLDRSLAAADRDRLIDSRAADLAPVVPRLSGSAPERQRARPAGEPESRRYRLFEAVAGLLEELAALAPVLLLVDDLQWSDQATVALLGHVLDSRPAARLLVVATQRTGEVEGPLADALGRLARSERFETVPLAPLAEADVGAIAESISGQLLAPELVRAISRETAGNPFFVGELIRHLGDDPGGILSARGADVPERVREVVDLRLNRLGENCVRLLGVAAVLGGEFDLPTLEAVSDLEGGDLTEALDRALAAGVVVEVDDPDLERFAFSHALVRRTLLARLTRPQRRRIHARVAEAIRATRGERALLEIAHHLCEARPVSDREEALAYAVRAAEQAAEGLAYAEAVDMFTRARSLLPPEDERRRALGLKRAVAYQALFHAVMDAPDGREASESPPGDAG
jgi:DNA-binding SARP family transcriptional activator